MSDRRLAAVLPRIGGALAALAFGFALSGPAQAAGPYGDVVGVWGGTGSVLYASGAKERLSCRAQYVQNDDDNLQQALKCASDSYNFQINAYFESVDGDITGIWEEIVRNISGTVSGKAARGSIKGALHGPGFVAKLKVTTTGNRQKVRIETPDQDIRVVDITVRKSSSSR